MIPPLKKHWNIKGLSNIHGGGPRKVQKVGNFWFFAENLHFHENPDFRRKSEISRFSHFSDSPPKNLHNRCIFQWFLEVESKETAHFAKFPLFLENLTFSLKWRDFTKKCTFSWKSHFWAKSGPYFRRGFGQFSRPEFPNTAPTPARWLYPG